MFHRVQSECKCVEESSQEFPKGKLLASQPFIVELEVEKENCVAECRVNLALLSHYDSPFNAQNLGFNS